MDQPVVRKILEEVADKNNLSGDVKIIMSREYDEECFHCSDDFKDEIFENSDLSYYISKVLEHLPVSHNTEIYNLYTEEFPPDEEPGRYLWNIAGDILSLEEVKDEFADNPLYDPDKQNVAEMGDPLFDADILSEFIVENLHNMRNIIEWNVQQYDHKRGNATVSTTLTLTIDQIMNLPDYALSGWDYSVPVRTGTVIIEG
jgi:hypothetical protein